MSEGNCSRVEYRSLDFLGYLDYKVGNDGSVWSSKVKGSGKRIGSWRRMCLISKEWGHLIVGLSKNNKTIQYRVHRLILEAFVGSCPEGMECCHNDGNPKNNQIGNLRWGTSKSNKADKKRHGTENIGSRNGSAKLKETDIPVIRDMLSKGRTSLSISKLFDVKDQTILNIKTGHNWGWVV